MEEVSFTDSPWGSSTGIPNVDTTNSHDLNIENNESSSSLQVSAPLYPPTSPVSKTIQIKVTDTQKHGEGKSAYISYCINSITSGEDIPDEVASIRRRFQDFVWLHSTLSNEYAACILPPAPGKKRMEYITGDRFSSEFIEKRRSSLESYLQKLARHPTIKQTPILKKFLTSADLATDAELLKSNHPNHENTNAVSSHLFEGISEVLINAFSKVKKPDEKFLELMKEVDTFEGNLNAVGKFHSKLIKHQYELERNLVEFGNSVTALGVMETQVTSPLTDFGTIIRNVTLFLKEKISKEESQYLSSIHEYSSYCASVKETLNTREQKQIDHEQLTAYYSSFKEERDRLTSGFRAGGGIGGFLKDKISDLRGVDSEVARQDKLQKVKQKIEELEEAVESSKETSDAFSKQVEKEYALFQENKVDDFKQIFRDYTSAQIEYHEKCLKSWEEIIGTEDDHIE